MRRIHTAIFIMVLLLLAACSSGNNAGQEVSENDPDQDGKVEVDKGLLNVELHLPASFFEGEDIDEVIAEAKEEGVAEVTKNNDGSLTYKMSKSKHKEMMADMKDGLIEYVDELTTSEDYPSIKEVTYHKSFNEFTVVVDKEAYESGFDGFATLGLGMSGLYYQLFNGANMEESKVTIHVEDEATGEVFGSMVYPDVLEESSE